MVPNKVRVLEYVLKYVLEYVHVYVLEYSTYTCTPGRVPDAEGNSDVNLGLKYVLEYVLEYVHVYWWWC